MADKKSADGSVTKRVGDFYASGMDSTTVEKRGFSPKVQSLKNINAINTMAQAKKMMLALTVSASASPLHVFSVG